MSGGGPTMEWFYTAPLEDAAVRRGDPLGMRAIAEEMAERLAPGLSNRTVDGRWISNMCWALDQGCATWRAQGRARDDGAIVSRQAARGLYSWVRPLELLWLARTVERTSDRGKGRQLPGVRAVSRWLGDAARERFGFDAGAYERYRFTGVYGAYRIAFRSLPGLTVGSDGWRLDKLGCQLAEVVHGRVRCPRIHRSKKGPKPAPERYWQRIFEWKHGDSDDVPTLLASPAQLPTSERVLLERALFASDHGSETDRSNGARRRAVVEAAAASRAWTRPELFADIARKLGRGKPHDDLALFSPFCQLADAGVAAMNACWMAVAEGNRTGTGFASASDVLGRKEVTDALDGLVEAATRWQREASSGRPLPVANALAAGILGAHRQRKRQFQALERHHRQFGGGLKWLAIDGDVVKPLAPLRGGNASDYRFRIAALARLGVQCGVIHEMPAALRDSSELTEEVED